MITLSDRSRLYICLNLSLLILIHGVQNALATDNEQILSQLTIPPSPPLNSDSPNLSGEIRVTKFEFQGQTVFSEAELGEIIVPAIQQNISSISDRSFSLSQLLQVATQVADFYSAKGYKTSGAIIVVPEATQKTKQGTVIIKVLEGSLQEIRVSQAPDIKGEGSLDNYVRSRLKVKPNTPLNVDDLLEALQLLQLDPLITNVTAKLSASSTPGQNILDVTYRPAKSLSVSINLDNNRSPSVGTFQRSINLKEGNLSGLGDTFSIGFSNTDGSDRVDLSYQVPINSQNGSLGFSYAYSNNGVVEPPFDDLDLDGNSPDIESQFSNYKLTFRQPVIRQIKNQTFRELGLGVSTEWRETKSFLFNEPFPLSLGADISGQTKLFILHLSQDYTQQNERESLSLLSEFSLGLDAFGSTVTPQTQKGETEIPDGKFFSWRGQAQYVRLLAPDTLLLFRSNLQLANTLVSTEQFSLGGFGTVRGYRQDLLLTDNGFLLSAEARLPIWKNRQGNGVLQVIPFADYGIGWNKSGDTPDPNHLASVGLGLLWRQDNFSARLDWGIPLVNVEGGDRTWQENGLYFSVEYRPF
ncbi:ShlB/FhaC/HecB family hemolysin secretion/activation protein [Merismopedia glauca]|uniref:Hemolysin activation/secretion protein n=1 Tax=Merismopedia glauca CCAP 1448/3 TaxID=1296344 RepID=A0A2T1C0X3_9CYAN|nr:ShlB/FhaC/HecB family hemolysin secretion/activation protein [Merismopedia glauca]PSB01925.1 hemolysin activation/secretion protein [Merismopedia glauca CCAP 1448/3]